MEQLKERRITTRRVPIGRIAVAAFAVGGLSVSAVAVSAAGASTNAVTKVVVSTAKSAKFGKVLVSGKTLYTLKASTTPCTAACLKVWPALVLPKGVTKATAGSGVTASKLGTISKPGGIRQVTYGGKALYSFVGDTGAGQVNGNVSDEWGKWSAVVTVKAKTTGSGSGSTPTTAGSGGSSF
jgi:predicted lipoprotein with Yx(FWY)xxD motif